MIIIKIPFKTPTINHLYWHRGNMKIMTKEARELKERIKEIMMQDPARFNYLDALVSIDNLKLKVTVEIHEDWYTKVGKIKKKDISNREKFLIDSIFDALNIDDKFIFENTMRKIQDIEEFSIIKIEEFQ